MEPQSPNGHQVLPIKTSIYQIIKKNIISMYNESSFNILNKINLKFNEKNIYFILVITLTLGLRPNVKQKRRSMFKRCFKTQTHFHKCGKVTPNISKWFFFILGIEVLHNPNFLKQKCR